MNLHWIDILIIVLYLAGMLIVGFYLSKLASKDLKSYFLGENKIKWYYLGLSNASGMFDISGAMWTVSILFIYGLKSAWLPWLWPVWNQIFVMVFLAAWMRRSNVLTGAEWILFRFGDDKSGRLSHKIIIIFALISVIGFIAYFVEGIGKFSSQFLPWDIGFSIFSFHLLSEQVYAIIIIGITTLYTIKGGFYSVVSTEVIQFIIMTVSCVIISIIAFNNVEPSEFKKVIPDGWENLFPEWKLSLDWSNIFPEINDKISADGFEFFSILLGLMIFKGIFSSLAGPVPSYDMQRILSARTPSEAAKMSGLTPLVLFIPRYLMITGLTVLALVYLMPELQSNEILDFEIILPLAIQNFVPIGVKGLLLAGLLAAFMGTFAAFINAAPAYLINDFYKKYINPEASNRKLVKYSHGSAAIIVFIGVIIGLFSGSINDLTLWISASLYGGYAAANALKWVWWRFNGYGYFGGMLGGLVSSLVVPPIARIFYPNIIDIYIFPVILFISLLCSIVFSLMTKPTDYKTLKNFFIKTKPWGAWRPVISLIRKDDPNFSPNTNFKLDAFNVIVGIIWQMTMVVGPIYFLSGFYDELIVTLLVFVVTSIVLKFTWYDNLEKLND